MTYLYEIHGFPKQDLQQQEWWPPTKIDEPYYLIIVVFQLLSMTFLETNAA